MSLADLISADDTQNLFNQAIEAVIVKGAGSRTDLVDVAIPTFDTDQAFNGLRWSRDGNNLPAAGASCIVQFTRTGSAWVTAWW
jgi:hypothetical protein